VNRAQIDPEQLYSGGLSATVWRIIKYPLLVAAPSVNEPKPNTTEWKVLDTLRNHLLPMCCNEIAKEAGVRSANASTALCNLRTRGLASYDKSGSKYEWTAT
jgi:hypothetical protein